MEGVTMAEWLRRAVATEARKQDGNQVLPPDKPRETALPSLTIELSEAAALLPILSGLMLTVLTQGRVADSIPWAQEMLIIAEATGDADLLIVGHARACACCCYAGEFMKSVEHANKVLNLYNTEKHRHIAEI